MGYSVHYRELPPIPQEDDIPALELDAEELGAPAQTVQADPGPEPFLVLTGLRAFTR